MSVPPQPDGVEIKGVVSPEYASILSAEAVSFLAALSREFEPKRQNLLALRAQRQVAFDQGIQPDFLEQTASIRAADWVIDPVPEELQDRRVEITGPVERKMVINALNSGANVFMADFEDSLSPGWNNLIQGQINLRDAVRRTIALDTPEGKHYALNPQVAVLFVRPRGWHMPERHLLVDGQAISASLFDFGLFFFHNARTQLAYGTGPYFYLPKMESHLEARLWNSVFNAAEDQLDIPRGTIKATVLIETIPAAFEMDEILHELKSHSAGLNCGRWDYIFSCIKKLHQHPSFMLAEREALTMTTPFMRAYSRLLIKTCHRRNAHAIGGMAAQIPIRNDPAANAAALVKVGVDKNREAADGHDGTWVAHPALVQVARDVFDSAMHGPNQIQRKREDVHVTRADLLDFQPQAPITEHGLRNNIQVSIEYMGAWLAGQGAVPIHHLMEDAATAEISRSQVWHWIRSPLGVLDDGRKVTLELVLGMVPEALQHIRNELGEAAFLAGKYPLAAEIVQSLVVNDTFADFMTLAAYEYLG